MNDEIISLGLNKLRLSDIGLYCKLVDDDFTGFDHFVVFVDDPTEIEAFGLIRQLNFGLQTVCLRFVNAISKDVNDLNLRTPRIGGDGETSIVWIRENFEGLG